MAKAKLHLSPLIGQWSGSWTTSVRRNLLEGVTLESILDIGKADVLQAMDTQKGKLYFDALLTARGARLVAASRTSKRHEPQQSALPKRDPEDSARVERLTAALPGLKPWEIGKLSAEVKLGHLTEADPVGKHQDIPP